MSRKSPVVSAFVAGALLTLVSACANPPAPAPVVRATPLEPGPNEVVDIDDLLLVVDASTSISDDYLFPAEKALLMGYVDSLPAGSYETGAVAFGGFDRQRERLSPFARSQVREYIEGTRHLREGTPLHKVFEEEREILKGRSGRAAVVVFSDGLVSDEFGRDIPPEQTLAAATDLANAYRGTVCFHTVELGDDPNGAELLRRLSRVTSCGSFRRASATSSEVALHEFHRDVLLGEAAALPAVAAAPPARCPGTPAGVPVDAQGCWQIPRIGFAFDSAVIDPSYRNELEGIAEVLRANPDTRLVIDGYTDTMGDPAYNRELSLRRAKATRDALVSSGVDESQLSVRGLGDQNPLRPNDTLEDRRVNRRSQLSIDH